MVDHLLEGRFLFGISPGGLRSDMEVFGNLDADRGAMFEEAIDQVLAIWAGEAPYNLEGEFWTVSTERTMDIEIGQGAILGPLQRPHPPIVVASMSPFSSSVTRAGERGWSFISANFLQPVWAASHWPKFVEGCDSVGREPRPEDWRVARSVFVADDDTTARSYATDPKGAYGYYYASLMRKLIGNGRADLFKADRDMADEEVTHDYVMDSLVIHGTPASVTERILELRERVGDFGTLVYAGHDWVDPALASALDGADGHRSDAGGERGPGRDADGRDMSAGAYERLTQLIDAGEAVLLDGAVATEIERTHPEAVRASAAEDELWGTWALYNNPGAVLDVHRAYVEIGCDVVSTDTWAILEAPEREASASGVATHWMDVARSGIRLARQAIDEAGRSGECAVAFSLNGDVDSADKLSTLGLLARVFEDEAPDLLLLETMSLLREGLQLRSRRGCNRDRATGVAQLSALPSRRLRRLRAALGRTRGGRVRSGGAAFRAAGRRRAPDQLPAGRSPRRDAAVAARLHRPAARRVSEPRLRRGGRLALRRARRAGRVRGVRARVARGGGPDRWRLLRHLTRAYRGRTRGFGRD